jgi:hypothetical protein
MLVLLILIELLVISISLLIFMVFRLINIEFYLIYYLIFRVCEGVIGLRLLVIIVRFRGSEIYYIFNIRKY